MLSKRLVGLGDHVARRAASPSSVMLAVPEMKIVASSPQDSAMPRENLGLLGL